MKGLKKQAAAASAKFTRAMSSDPMVRAADDLLEACKRALAHVTHEETTTSNEATKDAMRGVAKFLSTAIAKADGKTP